MRKPFQRKKLFAKNSSGFSRRLQKSVQRPQTRERVDRGKPKGIFRRKFGRALLVIRAFLFLALFAGIFLGIVSLSAFFAIQHVLISRTDMRMQTQDLDAYVKKFFRKNLVFLQKSKVQEDFFTAFPEIKEVVIHKSFPNTLQIRLSSYPVAFRWVCEYEKKTISEEGKIESKTLRETSFVNEKGLATASDKEDQDVFSVYEKDPCRPRNAEQKRVISEEFIRYLQNTKAELSEILGKPIVRAGYFRSAREVHFISEDETAFWIDFSSPPEKQLEKLRTALSAEPSLNKELDHVDLRITNKIFYAPKT
ncbi:FtsQ-type POTRA domain-containing protein [Candidatus Peregrinibacteria bacterium]|nr:MAG: FtsQ-type POTRA domain-containing protein [Candidatus Peregrinibacteria bacterium]